MTDDLTDERKQAILDTVVALTARMEPEAGEFTTRDYMDRKDITKEQARYELERLRRAGKLETRKLGWRRYWKLVEADGA